MMRPIEFTAIEGIRVGHAEDLEAATGCTVVISEAGATAGTSGRRGGRGYAVKGGGAPGRGALVAGCNCLGGMKFPAGLRWCGNGAPRGKLAGVGG